MKLQEQIYDNRSQDVTEAAMMWLQEQDMAAGVNMWPQENLVKIVSHVLSSFPIFQIYGLLEPLYLVVFF